MFEITPSSKWCREQKIGKILSSLVIDFTYLLKELDWRIYSAWFCTQLYLHWQRNWSNNCKKKTMQFFFYPARALRALGLLLADGAPIVGGGKTF